MAQIFTGSKAIVKVKGLPVGFASGVNVNIENTLADVDVLGQLDPKEMAETGHRASGSINHFKPLGDDVNSGFAALLGIDSSYSFSGGELKEGDLSSMRDQVEFDLEIVNNSNENKLIFKLVGCKLEGGSGSVDSRGIWQGVWNFRSRQGYGI